MLVKNQSFTEGALLFGCPFPSLDEAQAWLDENYQVGATFVPKPLSPPVIGLHLPSSSLVTELQPAWKEGSEVRITYEYRFTLVVEHEDQFYPALVADIDYSDTEAVDPDAADDNAGDGQQ
jgi:hypothetical protein